MDPNTNQGQNPMPAGDTGMGGGAPVSTPTPAEPVQTPPAAPVTPEPQAPATPAEPGMGTDIGGGTTPPPAAPAA